ncbi:MAG: carbamoyl-phosphate synthase large subunit, partial [Erysipelotrichaceae bacterium]
ADTDKEDGLRVAKRFSDIGYGIYATSGTAKYLEENGILVQTVSKISDDSHNSVLDVIRRGRVNYVVNTMSTKKEVTTDGFLIRRVAAENNISCFTSLDTAEAILSVIENQSSSTISMNELED